MLVLLSVAMREGGLARPSRRRGVLRRVREAYLKLEERVEIVQVEGEELYDESGERGIMRSGRDAWESKERIGRGGSMKVGSVLTRSGATIRKATKLIKSEFDTNGKRERFRI